MSTAAQTLAQRPPRWPASLAVFSLILVVAATPQRYVLGPRWLAPAVLLVLGTVLLVTTLRHPRNPAAARAQDRAELVVVLCVAVLNILSLSELIRMLLWGGREIVGVRLLGSSAAIWIGNIVSFALVYWLLDGGGPEEWSPQSADFVFQHREDQGQDQPRFLDYVYLSFSTATAFSATDTAPVTERARFLLMVEAAVSLLCLAITAARAVNVLT